MVDGGAQGGAEGEPLDALRRRLYRPGATAEDVSRYTAVRTALREPGSAPSDDQAATPAQAPAQAQARARERLRRRVVVAVAGGAVAATIAAGVLATAGTAVHPAAAGAHSGDALLTPSPGTTATWSARFNGDTAPTPAAPTPDATYALEDGRTATTVDGVAAVGQRFHGAGPAGVGLAPSGLTRGGRIVVAIASTAATHLDWTAGRPAFLDGSMPQHIVARGTAVREDGLLKPSVVDFRGAPPSWLVVEAPQGATWTLTVVLLPRTDSQLR